jgi:hypothetical protein
VKVRCMVVPFERAWGGAPGDTYSCRAIVNARGSTHGVAVFTGLTSSIRSRLARRYRHRIVLHSA